MVQYIAFSYKCKIFIRKGDIKIMEMKLNNGFCEMTENETMQVEAGGIWTVVGDCGAIVCTVGAMALGTTPLGLAATGAALIWGFSR